MQRELRARSRTVLVFRHPVQQPYHKRSARSRRSTAERGFYGGIIAVPAVRKSSFRPRWISFIGCHTLSISQTLVTFAFTSKSDRKQAAGCHSAQLSSSSTCTSLRATNSPFSALLATASRLGIVTWGRKSPINTCNGELIPRSDKNNASRSIQFIARFSSRV